MMYLRNPAKLAGFFVTPTRLLRRPTASLFHRETNLFAESIPTGSITENAQNAWVFVGDGTGRDENCQ